MSLYTQALLLTLSGASAIISGSLGVSASDQIVLGVDVTAAWSFWTGGSVTLSQCNERCSRVNTGLFTTCGAYQNVFQKQMQCCCSTTFAQEVEICSSCCNKLGYTAYYAQLVQVGSACDSLDTDGNTTAVAKTLSYTPVTYTATLPQQTATQVVVVVTTADGLPTTVTGEPATKTIIIVTTPDGEANDDSSTSSSASTTSTTTGSSSRVHSTSATTTTTTVVLVPSTSTTTTTTKLSTSATMPVILPTYTATSSAGTMTFLYFKRGISFEVVAPGIVCISAALALLL